MVVFACNSCGTSLKKNQVEKHGFQCRFISVSCMDCQKDFGKKDYVAHIKCVSEAEKYGGNDWKAPSNFNKGEKKQQAWVDTVNETLRKAGNNLSPQCRSLMQTLTKHDNVPRKKPKFMNFLKNISKNRFDTNTIENVWNLLEAEWKSQAEAMKKSSTGSDSSSQNGNQPEEESEKENEKDSNGVKNGVTANGTEEHSEEQGKPPKLSKKEKKEARRQKQQHGEKKDKRSNDKADDEEGVAVTETENGTAENGTEKLSKKERKKRKRLESGSEELEKKKTKDDDDIAQSAEIADDSTLESTDRDFKWGSVIREILLKQSDHELSMKKLRKKVFAEYYAVVGDSKGSKTKEDLISKLNKKLKKRQFKVINETVKLVVDAE